MENAAQQRRDSYFFSITNLQQKENKASGVPALQFTESEREKESEKERDRESEWAVRRKEDQQQKQLAVEE